MEKTMFPYGLIYGPHYSRRFGFSLGVDLTPMACTFNCIYCERGATIFGYKAQEDFNSIVDVNLFLDTLKHRIKNTAKIDCLTFSGTGEPTLESKLGFFISSARRIIDKIPIKVITNSSLLNYDYVIQNLTKADEVIAKLNAVSNDSFLDVHRPYNNALNIEDIIEGIQRLKKEIDNKLTIEILFLNSFQPININSTNNEIDNITETLQELQPNKIHIHTIRRVPAEPYVLPIRRKRLEQISTRMKNKLSKTSISLVT